MNPRGKVKVFKWPYKFDATEALVKNEMLQFGYEVYDLQTIAGWYERSDHAHDFDEIRGATSGNTTFYFENELPVTLEPGDIILIPAGTVHKVLTHNSNPFTAFKGSTSGTRSVTEHGDGKGRTADLP
jgi:cupin superfamily acireductone dioxygenase involved in methionine salvage